MTPSAILALVVVLNAAATSTEETAAILPSGQCLDAMRAIWSVPAGQVDGAPTVDAYCVDPDKAPPLGEQVVRSIE